MQSNDPTHYIDITPKDGLKSAIGHAQSHIESRTNYPIALRIKRADAIRLADISVPHYDQGRLAQVKSAIKDKAAHNPKFTETIAAHPHIFGDDGYTSAELEEHIIIEFDEDTTLNAIRTQIHDNLELCDTIALVQLRIEDGQEGLSKIAALIESDQFASALDLIKDARTAKQDNFKFQPNHRNAPLTHKISEWLEDGIATDYHYAHGNALLLELPDQGAPKSPNMHGFNSPFLWIEDKDGHRVRPEHLFIAMREDKDGKDALHFEDFHVLGFDLAVPLTFQSFEFVERLEHSLKEYFNIELPKDLDFWQAADNFIHEKSAQETLSAQDMHEAHTTLIMIYLAGHRYGINTLNELNTLNAFIAKKMHNETNSSPAPSLDPFA